MRHLPATLGALGVAVAVAVPAAAAPTADSSAEPAPQETAKNAPQETDNDGQEPKVDTVKQKVDADSTALIDATGTNDENTVVIFGATWAGDAQPKVEYRSKVTNSLKWSMWQELEADPDEGPDDGSNEANTPGTGAVSAAYNEKIEVRTTGAPVTVTVTTTPITDADRTMFGGVNDEGTFSSPDLNEPASSAPEADATSAGNSGPIAGGKLNAKNAPSIGGFKYFSRKQWGARKARCSTSTTNRNSATIIHHTEGSNSYSKEQVPGILRGIQSYHQGSRQWCDIGYNMLVDKYGNIYEGRPKLDKAAIGAHASSVNRGTFGISVIGSYKKKAPEAVINSVARIVAWQSSKWNWKIDSKVTLTSAGGDTRKYPKGAKMTVQRVSGHRDVGNTDCPGDGLYSQLGDIRKKAIGFQKGKPPAPAEKPKSPIQKFHEANKSKTGKPTGKEHGGLPGGGAYRAFEKGAVHHSPKTGTHFTRFGSGIQKAWAAQAFERGALGYPTGEESCTIKDGGCYQAFQNGSIHWSPKIGARKLMYDSAIRKEWAKQGFERGSLGYPTTEEFTWGKYKRVNFEGGYLTWTKEEGVKHHKKK
ncbi:N-acetylmuramoyl-L-alanine amidase [Brevibacterium sp. HMSC24B04]|uniref:N-acetylmuramoyl-L-alanine amidase n=1 Tax=Brevibacterium sp. HMSC24B04 TaxID=1581060 RepID=UPI0008A12C69|nr:N-acetylmuramoyl-L-alanine amidase [Brevibacterium sp. HMSC24B04]OFT94589.1 hypothetical protein HMPREF3092_02790 [Brevibacterium sp. HMSC24B04]